MLFFGRTIWLAGVHARSLLQFAGLWFDMCGVPTKKIGRFVAGFVELSVAVAPQYDGSESQIMQPPIA